MNFDINKLEDSIFDYVDKFKVLLSSDTWENVLLNCTKNEMLVLMMLYRQSDVNMSSIAEYINAPLNTTTGIVSRMEKKNMIRRIRSTYDKRVVTIVLTEEGSKEISEIKNIFLNYGQRLLSTLDSDEISVLLSVFDKLINIMQNPIVSDKSVEKKVRKITIE